MKHKIFTLFFALLANIGALVAQINIGDLYYNLNQSTKTAMVTYKSLFINEGIYMYNDVWEMDHWPIGAADIPSTVTYEGETYNVTSIGAHAFEYCDKLSSVSIPNSVTSIGECAFAGCNKLSSVSIPNSVTSIGDRAFDGCKSLTSIVIPNSVTSIGSCAFVGCISLTSFEMANADNLTHIGDEVFYGCTALTTPIYNSHIFVYLPTSYMGAYAIPNGIETIVGGACYGCEGLTSIEIPNSVTKIGYSVFRGCTSLANPICHGRMFVYLPTSYTGSYEIPYGIESIIGGACSGCEGLTSVVIPNSVTNIGQSAFSRCKKLTSIELPNRITSIENGTFRECTGLTSIVIPNNVTSIGRSAFELCERLETVTLGTELETIGEYAFYNCKHIVDIYNFAKHVPIIKDYYTFSSETRNAYVWVPENRVRYYEMDEYWKKFNIVPMGATSVEITKTNVETTAYTATVSWPAVSGAATYELVIKDKAGDIVCSISFNSSGQLISITFNAPGRDNSTEQTQSSGFLFTVTSLEQGTTYDLTITAKDENGVTLNTQEITFTTAGESHEGLGQITDDVSIKSSKILRNGQIYILRGNKTYTITGQEVR